MTSPRNPSPRTPNPWWVGIISGMASYVDAAAIVATGIALVIYQSSLGITPDQIGILSGTLTLGIAVGAIVGGRLGDRFGRRSVFIATMAMITLGSGLLVFSQGFAFLFIGIVLVGLGTGADLPVSLATIAECATDKNRGALVGLSNLLWLVGILVTMVISSVAGGWGHLGGQLLFGHIGVVALVLLILRVPLPESPTWLMAREERASGTTTVRASKVRVQDLLKGAYSKPFVALLLFYALVNAAANTQGQFGTYIGVNVAGIPVEVYSRIALLTFPVTLLAGLWFMKIVDTKHRMAYFVLGAVAMVASYLIPAILGFTMATIVASIVVGGFGTAFAFEGIMKVWTQESFPTMLRSTAQGTIISAARLVAAGLAVVTPGLINAGAQTVYFILAGVVAVGLSIAWWAFHDSSSNEFATEEQLDPLAAADAPESSVA